MSSRTWRCVGQLSLLLLVLAPLTGCVGLTAHLLNVIYGHTVPPLYDGLQGRRVAVVCVSNGGDYGPDSPSSTLARYVEQVLRKRVKKVELIRFEEVQDWIDRNDWDAVDYREIGRGVKAEMVVALDLKSFAIHKGQTLYQGRADVKTSVFDMRKNGEEVWSEEVYDFSFPVNGARHATEVSEANFRRDFIKTLAHFLAKSFFAYELQEDFAFDPTYVSGNRSSGRR